MTKLELINKKLDLRNQADAMLKQGKAEKRELNSVEEQKFAEIRKEISDIDKQIADYDKKLAEEKRQNDIEKETEKRNIMTKNKFSLVSEIRQIADGKRADRTINMPAFENREYTVTGNKGANGGEDVPTVIEGLLTPLYDNQVLSNFTWMTGLSGDVKLPRIGANNCAWADEVAEASKTDSTIKAVTIKPKRLSTYVDISKQLLIQANSNIESVVRTDIQNALADKLQKTILGADAGTETQPAGIFNDAEAMTAVDYKNIIEIEETVEEANAVATGYIINPKVKATTRQVVKAQGQGGFLFDGGQLDGMPTAVTNAAKGIVYGNLKDYVIGQWGDIEIVVDPYTRATFGEIRLVINAYFDGANRRPDENTIVAKTLPTA